MVLFKTPSGHIVFEKNGLCPMLYMEYVAENPQIEWTVVNDRNQGWFFVFTPSIKHTDALMNYLTQNS